MARYPTYHKRRTGGRRWLTVLILIVAGGAGGWAIYGRDAKSSPTDKTDSPDGDGAAAVPINPDIMTTAPGTEQQRELALQAYKRGMELKAKGASPLDIRSALSKAVLSGYLTGGAETAAVAELTKLANAMILSPRVSNGDPYCSLYTFFSGDMLDNVERRLKLYVSSPGLLRINNRTDARRIREGATLKMIKGPFHAIIYKSRHIMDIYLQRYDMEKVFVRRIKVGLGKDGVTPVGSWMVSNRLWHPVYNPSFSSHLKRRAIPYGDPDYAFGNKGLWIGLKGADAGTESMSGYGLHSTGDQSSIGKDASEGCIRLSDEDVDLVYDFFYAQRRGDIKNDGLVRWSTVHIRP